MPEETFHMKLTITEAALASNSPELELQDAIRTFQREVLDWLGRARAAELGS